MKKTSCNFPPDTVSLWSTNYREIYGSKYKNYYKMIKERLLQNKKTFIFGDPGMGKTTILLNLSVDLKAMGYFPIFVDMSSDKPFVDEFWSFVKTSGIQEKLNTEIVNRKEEFGYKGFTKLKKDFIAWMKSQCKKGIDNPFVRIYSINFPECNVYEGLDGLIKFLDDLRSIQLNTVLLIDEARAEHYYPYIHKIINSGVTYLAVASPTSVLNSIKDEATIRRIRENSVILEPLTKEDAVEILSQMCKDIGENLAKEVFDPNMTIAQLIIEAKEVYQELLYECKHDLECVKSTAKDIGEIKNIQDASKSLEAIIRECIKGSKEVLEIEKVYDTGKRVKGSSKQRQIDIVLISHGKVFLGDVKLTNEEFLKNSVIENVLDVISEREQELDGSIYSVGGVFIITNGEVKDFPGKVIKLPNRTVKRALRKNTCTTDLRERVVEELRVILKSSESLNQNAGIQS
ncbi:hypothetical protein [Sulfurisphaera ohwakuensis]|uniref:AAA+ ATPase domain-containing protein n=1 Tax=Sulfurisphaera ohwakuensis TaxID=69656 RepID=A0A650CI39_SULOH|nr:hypothetical protein [Sulfurisphaera ohwakuensis]MBB5254879.1 hypothetical protein [Sulfurisphaera ohwakuensis]QGR17472.1 hypothetical protein D1869_09910 [Sulfurisphaera ohwakuensis]